MDRLLELFFIIRRVREYPMSAFACPFPNNSKGFQITFDGHNCNIQVAGQFLLWDWIILIDYRNKFTMSSTLGYIFHIFFLQPYQINFHRCKNTEKNEMSANSVKKTRFLEQLRIIDNAQCTIYNLQFTIEVFIPCMSSPFRKRNAVESVKSAEWRDKQ